MGTATTHRDWAAWREAMALVETAYRDTAVFPKAESFGLTARIRRAAVSVPSNLAEGAARNTSGELLQFLGITCGSLAELETQIELALRLGYLRPGADAITRLNHVGKLVRTLRKSMKNKLSREPL